MLFNWLFASSIDEVGVSFFDFYSIGHVCLGIGVFLFFSFFYTIPKHKGEVPILSLLAVFLFTVIMLVVWELVENIVLIEIGLKFEGRADSWQNITTDILLGMVGGVGSWIYCYLIFEKDKNIWLYYIMGIIALSIWIIFFFVGRYITYWYDGLYVLYL